jgi:hypothetical protein
MDTAQLFMLVCPSDLNSARGQSGKVWREVAIRPIGGVSAGW